MSAIVNDRDLVRSLRSDVCPACAGPKKLAQTFCWGDYRRLPAHMKTALYSRLGQGYAEAVSEAMTFLNAERFCLPGDEATEVSA